MRSSDLMYRKIRAEGFHCSRVRFRVFRFQGLSGLGFRV